jgi:hypothetical protein
MTRRPTSGGRSRWHISSRMGICRDKWTIRESCFCDKSMTKQKVYGRSMSLRIIARQHLCRVIAASPPCASFGSSSCAASCSNTQGWRQSYAVCTATLQLGRHWLGSCALCVGGPQAPRHCGSSFGARRQHAGQRTSQCPTASPTRLSCDQRSSRSWPSDSMLRGGLWSGNAA